MGTVVVLASQGQLGSLLLRELRRQGREVVGVDVDVCDLCDARSVAELFGRFPRMEWLYNGAAFTAVDAAEERRRLAYRVNALGPGMLASHCAARGIGMVHFSTDYVFGEGHSGPIEEGEEPSPLSVYGQSKWLGEELVMRHHPGAYVFRSCGLYSAHRPNFVRTMARLALERDRLEVVADQVVAPTRAASLARVAVEVVGRGEPGLYHAAAQGGCSWYEFARAIMEDLGIGVGVVPVSSARWSAPARRPPYSVLSNGLLRRQGLDTLGHWREELREFLDRHGESLVRQCPSVEERGCGFSGTAR